MSGYFLFAFLAFIFSYGLAFATMAIWPQAGTLGWVNYVAVTGPTLAALFMVRREGGHPSRWLIARFRAARWRWWWLLVPAPFLGLVALLGAPIDLPAFGIALLVQTLFIALPEEIGWRGWLADRLLEKNRAIIAVLVSGAIWGLWHGPKLIALPSLFLVAMALSMLLVFAYRALDGGVPLAALIHGSFNAAMWQAAALPPERELLLFDSAALAITGLTLLLFVARRRWFLSPQPAR